MTYLERGPIERIHTATVAKTVVANGIGFALVVAFSIPFGVIAFLSLLNVAVDSQTERLVGVIFGGLSFPSIILGGWWVSGRTAYVFRQVGNHIPISVIGHVGLHMKPDPNGEAPDTVHVLHVESIEFIINKGAFSKLVAGDLIAVKYLDISKVPSIARNGDTFVLSIDRLHNA